MLARKIKSLNDSYEKHIMQVRVDADKGALAVLSDIHEGLNNRKQYYCKASGIRPGIGGFYIAEMNGIEHQRQIIPYLDHQLQSLIERGYSL